MERAIEMCKDLPIQVEIEYRPYRIYPSLKDGQFVDKRSWYESRFGKERVETMEKMAVARAEELKIKMCVSIALDSSIHFPFFLFFSSLSFFSG